MWRFLCCCIVLGAQAFAPAPIRWEGLAGRRFVLAPKAMVLDRAVTLPQTLTVVDPSGEITPHEVPHFTANSDKTITWDTTGLCLEANGDKLGDVVQINSCTGEANQLWDVMPAGSGRNSRIRLRSADNLCMDMNGRAALNGAPVALQGCDEVMTESWNFEGPLPLQRDGLSLLTYLIVLVALPAIGLSAWVWRWQRKARAMRMHLGSALSENDGGGVSLVMPNGMRKITEPLVASSGLGVTPAVMTVATLKDTNTTQPQLLPGCLRLHHSSGATCDISQQGAHVVSWCPQPGNEQLFLGSLAQVGEPGVSIRGGIPICWPQFGPFMQAKDAPGQKHGFVRTSSQWKIAHQEQDSVTFVMTPNEDSSKWAADFEFRYSVSLGTDVLKLGMEVANNGEDALEFTGCLHTYFRCDAVDQCSVKGLRGASMDLSIGDHFRGDKVEARAEVPFTDEKETQLLFSDASDRIVLCEGGKDRLRLTKANMPDWVLWNTGLENGSGIKDLAEMEYRKYACVEPGFASKPIHVKPGEVWAGFHEVEIIDQVSKPPASSSVTEVHPAVMVLAPVEAPVATQPPLLPGCVRLHHSSGATCDISQYGAHVVSWCPQPGKEQLFLGSMAKVGEPGVSIRGGIPICWPQFGPFMEAKGAPGQKHGFVRTSTNWRVAKLNQDSVTFVMTPNEDSSQWKEDFEFKYSVSIGKDTFAIGMEVTNNGEDALEFTRCLHTYFKCDAVDMCSVRGLQGANMDSWIGDHFRGDRIEDRTEVPFTNEKETQLLFGDASDRIILSEGGKDRLRLTKANMPDWVLWNTGLENGSGIKDLADMEYRNYVCVEPGFASKPIHVKPGEVWTAFHEVQVIES